MHRQYEQACNAAALYDMGVKVLPSLSKKYIGEIKIWIKSGKALQNDYPDNAENVVTTIMSYIKQRLIEKE